MEITPRISARDFTSLPVEEVKLTSEMKTQLAITTPHKGKVIIKISEFHSGIFKPTTKHDRDSKDIVQQLYQLEKESKEYLFNQ